MTLEKKVTIRQVASTAGVSIQTVSRVVNNHPYVADETRQRVQEVISQLKYRPDAIARSLIKGRSYTLGVVVAELEHNGPHRLLAGIEKQATALGYSLSLSIVRYTEPENAMLQLERLFSHQVDGVIWAVPEINNHHWVQTYLRSTNIPIVFVTGGIVPGLPTVLSDNRSGGCLATEHLLAHGYRQIGLISGPRTWTAARERQRGWQEALAAANQSTDNRRVMEGDWSAASGEHGLYHLIEQFPEIDAVFACNDYMALGALQVAYLLGRRVPEDLAVVGFDATPEAAYFWPPLTSVRQHLLGAGSAAVGELSRVIELTRNGENDAQPTCVVIQPELIVRKSSVPTKLAHAAMHGV
jgi:LacI family transcriptional regulator